MVPTLEDLKAISKATRFTPAIISNMNSVIVSLDTYGHQFGLDLPHRLEHYLGQLSHENGGFKYDKEIWGNTAAQQKYDTRTDLGNTKARDGDGKLYMGRSGIQLTGKANYIAFRDWCKRNFPDAKVPDFVRFPDKINTDPWEGLVPIWYWSEGNPTRKSLNVYADENNIEQITKKINGGTNGLGDRIEYTVRSGLVLLGYVPTQVEDFQKNAFPNEPDEWDNDAGPKTRTKIHEALAMAAQGAIVNDPDIVVKKAPVTQTEEIAVTPKGIEKPAADTTIVGTIVGTGILSKLDFNSILGQFKDLTPWIQGGLIVVAVGFGVWFVVRRLKMAGRATDIIEAIAGRKSDGLPL